MAKFQEQDHTSTAPTSDIPINNHLTLSAALVPRNEITRHCLARAHPNLPTSNISLYSPHHGLHIIIPVGRWSFRRDQDHHSSEADILPGSSLLNIQDYHSSLDDSSVSPSPPPSAAKGGQRNSGTESRRHRSSPQFADFFTSEKRSLPPLFRQHRPNNSRVAASPRSGESRRPAFIFQNHRLDSSHSPENFKWQMNSFSSKEL